MKLSRFVAMISSLALAGIVCVAPCIALAGFADNVQSGIRDTATPAGLSETPELTTIVGNVINVAISFVGVVLLGYLIYGGFIYMTSQGDPKKSGSAMSTIRSAVVGLLIVASAYAISNFVLNLLIGNVLSSAT